MDILGRIVALRKEKGWTEYRLSVESGIPQSTISSWFRKSAQPSIASLEAICHAAGITLSAFFADGEAHALTPEQERLLSAFSHLEINRQAALLTFLESFNHGSAALESTQKHN